MNRFNMRTMKFFGSFFEGKGSSEKKSLPWTALTEVQQLESAVMESFRTPVLIYKHSTRCGISSVVLNRMERSLELREEDLVFYFLDLIRYRRLSQRISTDLGVVHESPQVILLNKGKVIWHGSHGAITAQNIIDHLP